MTPAARAQRTRRLISVLRAAGPVKQKRRIPPPVADERLLAMDYARAIQGVLEVARRELGEVMPEVLRLLEEERKAREAASPPLRMDAARPPQGPDQDETRRDKIQKVLAGASVTARKAWALIERAARRFVDLFAPAELRKVTRRFGEQMSYRQRLAFDQTIRAAIGVPLSMIEGPVVAKLDEWAALNVDLIKTISERYFDRVRLDVLEAYEAGTTPAVLSEQIEETYGVSERDATRIARDQLGKLNGNLNQARQEALGVETYIWRTVRDNRVRDEHSALEGQRVRWDEPPLVGPYGQPAHPGEAIQCRCFAEPDVGALLDDMEAA